MGVDSNFEEFDELAFRDNQGEQLATRLLYDFGRL